MLKPGYKAWMKSYKQRKVFQFKKSRWVINIYGDSLTFLYSHYGKGPLVNDSYFDHFPMLCEKTLTPK